MCGCEAKGTSRTGSPAEGGVATIEFEAFDTRVRADLFPAPGMSDEHIDSALCDLRARCMYFERALSRTRPDSDVSRARDAAPDEVSVQPETAEVVRLAQEYCEASGGLFDVTMGTVTRLWDFHAGVVPPKRDVARALGHVGAARVRVGTNPPCIAMPDAETLLDLGGIAKGYIADDLAVRLQSRGFRSFALNLGGNVVVRGGRPVGGDDGMPGADAPVVPWSVGVADPHAPGRDRALVRLSDGSVVTSGSRERRFAKGGSIYHHILDPRTGFPARSDVASATVVSSRSYDGDAYATTMFLLGAKRALEFAEGLPGIEAVVIDESGRVGFTAGLAGVLEVL